MNVQKYTVRAAARGARVSVVAANVESPDPAGSEVIRVGSAEELREAAHAAAKDADVVIMAAAVADFRPAVLADHKIKKSDAEPAAVDLVRNPDVLAELVQARSVGRLNVPVIVGFAAETQDLMANAAQKVRTKHLDFIVANDISDPSIGFASDENRVHILDAAGQIEELPTMVKARLADDILDRVQIVLAQRPGGRL